MVVFLRKNHRTPGHGILRFKKEAKPGDFSSCLSPHHNSHFFMVLLKIITWRTRCHRSFLEFHSPRYYVQLLFHRVTWLQVQKIPLVEKIYDLHSTDTIWNNVILSNTNIGHGLPNAEGFDLLLRNERDNLHLLVQ